MLIIIPAYNEEESVFDVVTAAREFGPVAVIDDGSQDHTALKAQLAGAEVITQGANWGYSAALRAGYVYAIRHSHDYVVQLDADGQHDPRYIPRMAYPVAEGEADITIGSRFYHPYPMDLCKSVGVMMFRRIVKQATGATITDTTSGYQCLNRAAMEHFLGSPSCQYPDANVIIKCIRAGLRVKEIPVMMCPNPQGRSMHRGARKIIRYMGSVMGEILREARNGLR